MQYKQLTKRNINTPGNYITKSIISHKIQPIHTIRKNITKEIANAIAIIELEQAINEMLNGSNE